MNKCRQISEKQNESALKCSITNVFVNINRFLWNYGRLTMSDV